MIGKVALLFTALYSMTFAYGFTSSAHDLAKRDAIREATYNYQNQMVITDLKFDEYQAITTFDFYTKNDSASYSNIFFTTNYEFDAFRHFRWVSYSFSYAGYGNLATENFDDIPIGITNYDSVGGEIDLGYSVNQFAWFYMSYRVSIYYNAPQYIWNVAPYFNYMLLNESTFRSQPLTSYNQTFNLYYGFTTTSTIDVNSGYCSVDFVNYLYDYATGENNSLSAGYSAGYETGYEDGYTTGNQVGYSNGFNAGQQSTINFMGLFGAIADTPVLIIRNLFGFELFGVSALAIFMTLLTGLIVIHFIRKVI